ncbi:ABC transporter substrate-binding protein [Azospirillum sp. A1-3]|uniref:ABC transporter substrate-binding protein n=1 Tax=Azospirillum sp. A1-3 TaxID=185874 RepID=UPI0020775AB9|nr:ABC transporter substrate-binding protein [Azospirillum sp. A1-3]MCM8737692.1 ABC transporter substrate-binding protein [Azospirillum sp. A1-3]
MISRRAVLRGMSQAATVAAAPPLMLDALRSSKAHAAQLEPLTIGIGGFTFAYLPLLVAISAKHTEEEGLEVSLVNTGSGSNTMAAMIGGSIDVAGLVMSDLILAASKGQKIKAFAPLMSQYASDAVISTQAAKKTGITPDMPLQERMARLKGLTLAVSSRGSGIDKLWRYLLTLGGLNPDRDVTLTVVKLDQMYSALRSGQIDGFNCTAPANNRAVEEGLAVWVARPSHGEVPGLENFLYTTLCARPDFLASRADISARMLRALTKASDLIGRDPAIAAKLMGERFFPETDLKLIGSAVSDQRTTVSVPLRLTEQQFQQNAEFMQRFNEEVGGVTYGDVVDSRLLKG